jgi:IclR family transcriptional regulator, KDG regulon repressor
LVNISPGFRGATLKILKKTIDALDLFMGNDSELALEDISRLTGLNKSTVRRMTISLMECGFLRQHYKRGKYSLGLKFLDYAQAVKKYNPVMDIAENYLIEACQTVNETVSLALWDGDMCVICQTIQPRHSLKVTCYEGKMTSLYYSSIGKAILAELPDDELDAYLPQELTRYTQNTITNIDDLKKHLITVRQQGVAIDDEEGFIGVSGIGAALKSRERKVVGAFTLLGPSIRLTHDRIRECIPVVKNTASRISKALGYFQR